MIDTIKVSGQNFQLRNLDGWSLEPKKTAIRENRLEILYEDSSLNDNFNRHVDNVPAGMDTRLYTRLYRNTPGGLRIDIKAAPKHNTNIFYLMAAAELPAYLNSGDRGYINPISNSEYCKALEMMNEELEKIGVEFDFSTAHFSRIDMFKNVVTEFPVSDYLPVFRYVSYGRQANRADYDGGLWVGNKSKEITIYDKVKENIKNGYELQDSYARLNVMRGELKYKTADAVRQLGITPVNLTEPEKYLELESRYKKDLALMFKCESFNEVIAESREYDRTLWKSIWNDCQSPVAALDELIDTVGLNGIIAKYGTLETFMTEVIAAEVEEKHNRYRIKKNLNERLEKVAKRLTLQGRNINLAALYNEIREKFLSSEFKVFGKVG